MEKIMLNLDKDHLIILSDLLYRISESDILDDFIEDKSELQAIWHLEGLLEKITPEIISGDYKKALQEARENYRHKE